MTHPGGAGLRLVFDTFTAKHFRGFHNLQLDELHRINLITGKNNVGKTALLEGIFVHCGVYNPELAIRVNAFRGFENVKVQVVPEADMPWDSLFRDYDSDSPVELIGRAEGRPRRTLRLRPHASTTARRARPTSATPTDTTAPASAAGLLTLEYEEGSKRNIYQLSVDNDGLRISPTPPPPPFKAIFHGSRARAQFSELADRYSALQLRDGEQTFVSALKVIEPRLTAITLLMAGGQPMLHGRLTTGRPIPLPLMGEGIMRLASYILSVSDAPNGVVLIDEIENGFHYSVLPEVWRVLAHAARRANVQIFTTTHSRECVVAAHEAFSKDLPYDLKLYRLEQGPADISVVAYDQQTLDAAVRAEFEVR